MSKSEIISIATEAIKFNVDSLEQYRLPVNVTFRFEKIREMAEVSINP